MRSLWHVSAEDILRLCAAVTGLERLKLVIARSTKSLVQRFPPMPLLTRLELTSQADDEPKEPARPAAGFLKRMPRLKDLRLESVLDEEHCGKDAKYVARFTDLTRLWLVLGEGFADQGTGPLSSAEVKPLRALLSLQSLMIMNRTLRNGTIPGFWDLRHASEFKQALRREQQRLGVPLVKLSNYRG